MRTLLLALLLAPAARAYGAADETNAVWLVVINETGQHLTEVTLDYGIGRFHYQLFSSGLTHGGYAKVKAEQPMVLRYTDSEGSKQERKIDKPLLPAMIGGIVRLTLQKDGGVAYEYSMATPAAHDPNVRDLRGSGPPWWVEWVLRGALALLGLAAVYYGIKLAVRLGRGAKEFFKDHLLEALKGPLQLQHVVCPIPMYSNDESRPESWWQGEYQGRMLGIRDGGVLWLGKEDEVTRGYFVREEAGGFRYHDHHGGKPIPGVGLHFKEELERLSPAVASVGVLSDALEVWLDPSGSPETLLREDLPRLEKMLEALGAAQEPS